MKRFLLFAGSDYYPLGGWNDLAGAYDTAQEAVLAGVQRSESETFGFYHVLDCESWSIVAKGTWRSEEPEPEPVGSV